MRTRTTATACGAVLVAVVVAGVSPILGQQEKFDLLIRGGHVRDSREAFNTKFRKEADPYRVPHR